MKSIQILSLPALSFAHIYKAETYRNRLSVRKNFLEVTYVAEGTLTLQQDNRQLSLKKGDISCSLFEKAAAISSAEPHCHYTVGAIVEWEPAGDSQTGLLLPMVTDSTHGTADITRLIHTIIHRQFEYKTNPSKGSAKIMELLSTIDDCARKNLNHTISGSQLYVQRAKNYIQNNLYNSITQHSVAQYLGISPGYLCCIFKEVENMTVMRYINTLKLISIKILMETTNTHLYEAAAMHGYTDPNYVSRLFKKYFEYNITDNTELSKCQV